MTRSARSIVMLLALIAASAAQATTYAVVPLIGRQLTVVTAEPVTSTNVDRNHYETLPIGVDVFDRSMRLAVERAVHARRAEDKALLVEATLPAPAPGERAAENLIPAIVDAVAPKALEAGAERLAVIAPYRATPLLTTDKGHIGTGHAEGLGLYVNRFQRTHTTGRQDSTYGFLGLFANFRVVIVDTRTRAVLAEDVATTGTMYSAGRAADYDPLHILTSEQKIAGLQRLVAQDLARLLPALLDKAGP